MKNGQCPKCGSHQVYSNTNRKFPALNTMTIGSANFGNRYAYLDTYICANCGYVENYVAKREDLNYIREEWVLVTQERAQVSDSVQPFGHENSEAVATQGASAGRSPALLQAADRSNEDSASLGFAPL